MTQVKLSLLAEYDELIRNRSVLTAGLEKEFLQFVLRQDAFRIQSLELVKCNEELKLNLKDLEQQNLALATKLKHARSQIDHEIQKRQKSEQERDSLEHQISLVKELLNDKNNRTLLLNDKDRERLAFLNSDFKMSKGDYSLRRNLAPIEESGSLLSPSDISYDKTEEDVNVSFLRSGKRWKHPSGTDKSGDCVGKNNLPKVKKKHRRSNSAELMTIEIDLVDGNTINDSVRSPERHRRFSSPGRNLKEVMVASEDEDDANTAFNSGRRNDFPRSSIVSTFSNSETPGMRRTTSGNALNRLHNFVSRTCMKPETCIACGKKLRFGKTVLRCKDCRANSHVECKELMPLPCVPTVGTPNALKTATGLISDYTSSDPPMIPAIIIHCVNEVESRGLNEVGIYRIPGSDKDVKELKEKFLRGKGTPNLNLVDDIHVVCGCLKDFLRGLKEPLVTYRLWHEFAKAAAKSDRYESVSDTYQVVSQLPQPNRDTLAFMILHLQRVAENPACKMPASNLSTVFGPTMIGYSSADSYPGSVIHETKQQQTVMERLLSVSADYWMTFINSDITSTDQLLRLMPYAPTEAPKSTLGLISVPGELEPQDRPRWFAPKLGSSTRLMSNKGSFFSSPVLK